MSNALHRRAALFGLGALLACGVAGVRAQQPNGERAPPGGDLQRAPFNSRPVDDLVGAPVIAADGQEIGAIVDLVSDRRNKFFAVVGVASNLGLGARNILVPMEQLQVSGDRVTLSPAMSLELPGMADYVGGGFKSIVPFKSPRNRG